MDRLASTGAERGRRTATQRELKAGIHLFHYKSCGLTRQPAPLARREQSLLDLGSRTDIAVERAKHAPEVQFPEVRQLTAIEGSGRSAVW